MTCPQCAAPIASDESTCTSCGASINPSLSPTLIKNEAVPSETGPISLDLKRFVSGTLLADRYRIVGLVGRGGMGEVYRAEDLKLGQVVALKFLPDTLLGDGAALARFHREVRIARQVSHPNVCRVFDIGEVEGRQFLSMEYIDGEDLASLLRRIGRLPEEKATEIARQMCAGIGAAHDVGVLHRDLKPANVMIDGRGRARITDFGLAVLSDQLRDNDSFAGTPAYMAPEQLSGGEITTRTDIYALGLILFELYTGRAAFRGNTLADYIRLHNQSDPATPTSIVKELDPLVERTIMRCLIGQDLLQGQPTAQIAINVLSVSAMFLVAVRFGLLAMLVATGVSQCYNYPITTNTTSWYFVYSYIVVGLLVLTGIHAFRGALAGQPIFQGGLLDD